VKQSFCGAEEGHAASYFSTPRQRVTVEAVAMAILVA
jgi:hypothetical protein